MSWTKDDAAAWMRKWRKANPEKVRANNQRYRDKHREKSKQQRKRYREQHPDLTRKVWLKQKYGITIEQYEEMLRSQGGGCAICGGPPSGAGGPHYRVDHCHKTNVIRGLLCNGCNIGLGAFKDDMKALQNAIMYLENSR